MNEREYKPDYSLISKYRTILMGIAIIFIMFCHVQDAFDHNGVPVTSLARAMHIFTVGVDIFMFVSGVGLYYSFTKRPLSYKVFEGKRLARILPSYFIVGGLTYLLYDLIIKKCDFTKFLRDLLFISWFRGESRRYWYILAIVVFYLLFPALYKFIRGGKNSLLRLVAFSICWWVLEEALCEIIPYVGTFRIALARLPIFAIGIYFGELSYEKKSVKSSIAIILLLAGYALFASLKIPFLKPVSDYLYYPVRAMLGISIMTTVIVLAEVIEKRTKGLFNGIEKMLGWFGGLTLELYLLHQRYMILFEYPYKLTTYSIVAFVLPTMIAGIIYLVRKKNQSAKGIV